MRALNATDGRDCAGGAVMELGVFLLMIKLRHFRSLPLSPFHVPFLLSFFFK